MATILKTGLYDPTETNRKEGNALIPPDVYVDSLFIQVMDEEGEIVAEFTYEELRGIVAIMEAEQEVLGLKLFKISKEN